MRHLLAQLDTKKGRNRIAEFLLIGRQVLQIFRRQLVVTVVPRTVFCQRPVIDALVDTVRLRDTDAVRFLARRHRARDKATGADKTEQTSCLCQLPAHPVYKPNALTRNTAICPRVIGSAGQ